MSEIEKRKQEFEAKIQTYVGLPEGPPTTGSDLVNEPMIRHWCDAMGDSNPVYVNADTAAQSVHGGIVAPPAMLQAWILPGYEMANRGDRDPENMQLELHSIFDAEGYTGVVATNTEQEYTRYLRPGDEVTAETMIESISEQKSTGLGVGYFVVTRSTFTNQEGEALGWMTFRVLKFRPSQPAQATSDAADAPAQPSRIKSPRGFDNGWWWEAIDNGQLRIQTCNDCGALRHPPRPACAECQSFSWGSVESTGKGIIHSYTVIHHPPVPGYDIPIPVGLVELEEGTRVIANIAGCAHDDIHIGMKVECRVEDADETTKLPFFYPAS
jgi:uncharacterized OB-fold protein/acyl dehydratase